MVPLPMRDSPGGSQFALDCLVLNSGGTAALAKTTLPGSALAGELPRSRRVISCEEVLELGLANWDLTWPCRRPAAAEGIGEITARPRAANPCDGVRVPDRRKSTRSSFSRLLVAPQRAGMATGASRTAREALDKLSIPAFRLVSRSRSRIRTPDPGLGSDLVCHVDVPGTDSDAEVLPCPGGSKGAGSRRPRPSPTTVAAANEARSRLNVRCCGFRLCWIGGRCDAIVCGLIRSASSWPCPVARPRHRNASPWGRGRLSDDVARPRPRLNSATHRGQPGPAAAAPAVLLATEPPSPHRPIGVAFCPTRGRLPRGRRR